MALAHDAGHRVVVVFATNGDHGTIPADLAPNETVADRRRAEAQASAKAIGIDKVAWLDYRDSGMTGWEQNGDPGSLAQADLDEAAGRLAAILDAEDADLLIGYDWHGGYGHPDHIKVHKVAYRAAELAQRRPRILEESTNRDDTARFTELAAAAGMEMTTDSTEEWLGDDGLPVGLPETELNWRVDVTEVLDRKRAALAAHASQEDTQWILGLPEQAFVAWLGFEHYREAGRPGPMVTGWPFESDVAPQNSNG